MSQIMAYVGNLVPFTAISVLAYYTVRAIALLAAVIVALCTSQNERRLACVAIVDSLCRGWPWPPRLPGSRDAP